AGDQLERPGGDFLAGTRDADDDGLAPAPVGALQGGAHDVDVADALEAVVHAPARHADDDLLDGFGVVLGVDTVGGAEDFRQRELVGIGVHGDDAPRPRLARALHHGQADAAQAEDGHGIAGLDLGGVAHGPDAGGHAAAQQADLLGVGLRVDLCQRDFRDDGVFAEGRAAHVVINGFALVGKARGAVGHQALALGGAHGHAQVGLARLAEQAFAAFGGIQGNDVVARRHTGDAFADLDDDARALVPQHGGEHAFGVIAAQGEGVGVADAGMGDPDQDLALAGRFDVDLDDLQGFAGLEGHGGAGFHRSVSNSVWPNGVQGRLW